jgi:4'-phosphopantetheinyl transferase
MKKGVMTVILAYGYAEKIVGDGSKESEAARVLLAHALKKCNIDASKLQINTDENGKPYFDGRSDIDFNISHSCGFVVCALSVGEGRVGVDVEREKSAIPIERQAKIAERFFSENEKKALADGESFVTLWTKREAYLKMTGDGFARGIGEEIPENVSFATFIADGYLICLCTEMPVEVEFCEYKDDERRNLK